MKTIWQLSSLFILCLMLVSCVAAPAVLPTQTKFILTSAPVQAVNNQNPQPTETTSSPGPATSSAPTQSPDPTITTQERTIAPVILIGWDGGQADLINAAIEQGKLPNLDSLAKTGLIAEYAQTVDPSLSAPAQTSLVTGAYPAHTGIVSNAFHNPNDSFYWYRTGFPQPIDQAEPIWVTASRAGLTTAALFIAGATPGLPGQMADFTIGYGIRDAYSSQEIVPLQASESWPGAPATYNPPLQGSFFIPEVARIDLLALDSTDDQVLNYDTVLIHPNSTGNPNETFTSTNTQTLEIGEWGSLTLLPNLAAGADFLLQEITSEQLTLYHTGVYHNTAAPRSLLEELNQKFNFFPAPPDGYALERGWITVEDYLYMLERASYWRGLVTAWVFETCQPDLLVSWQDEIDTAGHIFFLVDDHQAGYTPERAHQYASYVDQAMSLADQALGILLASVDRENTTILLTADHGLAPVHTTVYVNTLLEQARLLVLDRRDYVDTKRSKAFAVASGASVHIYLNLQGRQIGGTLPAEEYETVQAQVIDLLRRATDSSTDEPLFARVLAHKELAALHLDHAIAGDIFAQATPGYSLDDTRGKSAILEPSNLYGGHGYDSGLPEMHAFFIASGAGIPAQTAPVPPIRIIDIAPTIAKLLLFEPAGPVDGTPIQSILYP